MTVSIQRIENTQELLSAESEWKTFEKLSGSAVLTNCYEWIKTYWICFGNINNEAFGSNKRLFILIIRDNGSITAIAPLVIVDRYRRVLKTRIRIKAVEFLGQQWAGLYSDIVSLKEESCLGCIIDYLMKNERFDIIRLSYIPGFSHNFRNYEGSMRKFSICSEISINKPYPEIVEESYSKNLRKNMKKYFNKLEKSSIRYVIKNGYKEIRTIFDEIKKVSGSKLLSDKHDNYMDDNKNRFFTELVKNMQNPYCIAFYEDDTCIAYNIGFLFNRNVYAVDGSYNRNYSNPMNISFGSLVIDRTISNFAQSFSTLYLGPGTDPYKFHFSRKFQYLSSFIHPGNSCMSAFYNRYFTKKIQKTEEDLENTLKEVL